MPKTKHYRININSLPPALHPGQIPPFLPVQASLAHPHFFSHLQSHTRLHIHPTQSLHTVQTRRKAGNKAPFPHLSPENTRISARSPDQGRRISSPAVPPPNIFQLLCVNPHPWTADLFHRNCSARLSNRNMFSGFHITFQNVIHPQ